MIYPTLLLIAAGGVKLTTGNVPPRYRRYVRNCWVAEDQLWNARLGGDEDETISGRAAKARNAGRRWGCVLCRLLDWIDPDHCNNSIEADEGRNQLTSS